MIYVSLPLIFLNRLKSGLNWNEEENAYEKSTFFSNIEKKIKTQRVKILNTLIINSFQVFSVIISIIVSMIVVVLY